MFVVRRVKYTCAFGCHAFPKITMELNIPQIKLTSLVNTVQRCFVCCLLLEVVG